MLILVEVKMVGSGDVYAKQAMAITTKRTHALRQTLPMTQIWDGVRNCHWPGPGCTSTMYVLVCNTAVAANNNNHWFRSVCVCPIQVLQYEKNPADGEKFRWNVASPVRTRALALSSAAKTYSRENGNEFKLI